MATQSHRLVGLEPDNLLAFLALLGLMQVLEQARPDWRPRVGWDLEAFPLRPVICLTVEVTPEDICLAADEGLSLLAAQHDFGGKLKIDYTRAEARAALLSAREAGGYTADLMAALITDASILRRDKKESISITPLCLLNGAGHQHFLERLVAIPQKGISDPQEKVKAKPKPKPKQPKQGRRPRGETPEKKQPVQEKKTPAQALSECLFQPWTRLDDATLRFRWDPEEDVRYALQAFDPTEVKRGTQHGANRLAAIGLSALPVTPVDAAGRSSPCLPGGQWPSRDLFTLTWPIWRHPISLSALSSLLNHPQVQNSTTQAALGIDHLCEVRRLSVGKYKSVSRGRPL